MSKFIAVIYVEAPQNEEGTLSAFVDDDKERLIRKTAIAADRWMIRTGRTYRVLVGELTEEVFPPKPDVRPIVPESAVGLS